MRLSSLLGPDLRAVLESDPESLREALADFHAEDIAEILDDLEEGDAIALMRALADRRIGENEIARGLQTARWPARLQRLKGGQLSRLLPPRAELWLDGGHNADAGVVLAEALAAMARADGKPLTLIWGMLNTKDASQFFRPLAQLASHVITLTIPGEPNAIPAEQLAETVRALGCAASTATSVENAVRQAASLQPASRILICGSL